MRRGNAIRRGLRTHQNGMEAALVFLAQSAARKPNRESPYNGDALHAVVQRWEAERGRISALSRESPHSPRLKAPRRSTSTVRMDEE